MIFVVMIFVTSVYFASHLSMQVILQKQHQRELELSLDLLCSVVSEDGERDYFITDSFG